MSTHGRLGGSDMLEAGVGVGVGVASDAPQHDSTRRAFVVYISCFAIAFALETTGLAT
jgi:hypothetical protein